MIREIIESVIEDKWTDKVKTKHHIEGVWGEDVPAEKTAKEVCKVEGDLKSAVSAVNFYFNRCGEKCKDWGDKKRKEIIDILHKICKS